MTPATAVLAAALALGVFADMGAAAEPGPAAAAAYLAAAEGRKADALAAAQADPAVQYAVLLRFGLWDELIALGRPDPPAPGPTAGYLYGRGVALAARGRVDEARGALAELEALAAKEPSVADFVSVAASIVAARIAASELRADAAVADLERAVVAEDRLAATQAANAAAWFFPVRDLLGAQLLIAGRSADAERVYREDLARHPDSGWALYGLAAAQRAAGQARAAALTRAKFAAAWSRADVRLSASAFWFAGPDTTSCECQRQPSGDR